MPRDACVVADADEGDVRADVLQRELRLERGRGDAGLLERPGGSMPGPKAAM